MIINPLAQAAIFALVLAQVLSAKLSGMADNKFAYAIYLMAGLLAWSLFSEVISRCLTLFIENGNLLKKIVFPRICLPLIVTGSALLNNLLLLAAIIVVFALLGHVPGMQISWLPFLLLLTVAFALGIGLILGTLNVFIRDIGQVVPVVLQLIFWFTPIVYPPSVVPGYLREWMAVNPMFWVVQGYQNVILFNVPPPFAQLGWISLITVVLLGIALFMFRRAGSEMADVL